MADSYALALQKALYGALSADAGIQALVGDRVYDEPPDNAPRPFIRVGGIEVRPIRSDCKRGARVTFGIQCHSRPQGAGRVEVTRCAEAVVALLDDQPLVIEGFDTVLLHWSAQTAGRDEDGKSYTAIVAFIAIIDG